MGMKNTEIAIFRGVEPIIGKVRINDRIQEQINILIIWDIRFYWELG
jgi:hypothetical protein